MNVVKRSSRDYKILAYGVSYPNTSLASYTSLAVSTNSMQSKHYSHHLITRKAKCQKSSPSGSNCQTCYCLFGCSSWGNYQCQCCATSVVTHRKCVLNGLYCLTIFCESVLLQKDTTVPAIFNVTVKKSKFINLCHFKQAVCGKLHVGKNIFNVFSGLFSYRMWVCFAPWRHKPSFFVMLQ